MKRVALALFFLIFFIPEAFCALTKEYISHSVTEFNDVLISKMNATTRSDCKQQGEVFSSQFKETHKRFLSDEPLKAVFESLNLIERSARQAYSYPYCPLSIIPRTLAPVYYLQYYFQMQPLTTSFHLQRTSPPLTPSDSERAVLLNACQSIALTLTTQCKKVSCSAKEKKIIVFTNALVQELSKKQFSTKLVSYWLIATLKSISESVLDSKNSKFLSQSYYKIVQLLYMIENYVFFESDPNISLQTQKKIYKLLLNETQPASACTVLLFHFYDALNQNHQLDRPKLFELYITEHNKLFEHLNEVLYFKEAPNSLCSIGLPELFDIPINYAKQVRTELSVLL